MNIINAAKSIGYSLLGLATGNKGIARTINGFVVRFPARWSRYYEENYESDNYQFLKNTVKPGMHIIDVGAHLGLFSAISSQLAGDTGKIICFEPTPGTFEILIQTLQLNHCNNVVPVKGAVSNSEGTATFYVSETAGCNANSLINTHSEKKSGTYEVKLYTIDSIVNEHALHPDLIKIDAEGAEYDVLKGGVNTFKQQKPVLILGLHPAFIKQKGDSLEAIWDLLADCRYAIEMDGKSLSKEEFCTNTLLFDVHCK